MSEVSSSSSSLRSSATVLRGTITPGMSPAPSGQSASIRASRWPSVATQRSTLPPSGPSGDVHVDAVQIIARLFRRDGEFRFVEQAPQDRSRRGREIRQAYSEDAMTGKSSFGSVASEKCDRPASTIRRPAALSSDNVTCAPSGSLRTISCRVVAADRGCDPAFSTRAGALSTTSISRSVARKQKADRLPLRSTRLQGSG